MTSNQRPGPAAYLLLTIALVVTTGIAAVAFLGSFHAMADWSVSVGLTTRATSWTFPTVVDGAVLVASLLTIASASARIPSWQPRAAMVGALAVSIAVNTHHAAGGWPAKLGASVFPLGLALTAHLVFTTFHALLRRSALTSGDQPARASRWSALADGLTSAAVTRLASTGDHPLPITDQPALVTSDDQPAPVTDHPPVVTTGDQSSGDRRTQALHHWLATGGNVTRTAQLSGASPTTVRKWRAEDNWPDLKPSNGEVLA